MSDGHIDPSAITDPRIRRWLGLDSGSNVFSRLRREREAPPPRPLARWDGRQWVYVNRAHLDHPPHLASNEPEVRRWIEIDGERLEIVPIGDGQGTPHTPWCTCCRCRGGAS